VAADLNGKRDTAAIALLSSAVLAMLFVVALVFAVAVNIRQDARTRDQISENCAAINQTRAEVRALAELASPAIRERAATLGPISC
jgi:hypothetical protein